MPSKLAEALATPAEPLEPRVSDQIVGELNVTNVEVGQIDLSFRPSSYFKPADLASHVLRSVKGAERRRLLASILAEGDAPLPPALAEPALPANLLQSWGSFHPAMLGGEYLPERKGAELEIARITLQSVTQDVICVYAAQGHGRIRYRVVDEYGGDTLSEPARRTSVEPLTLGALAEFFLGAWNLDLALEMNFSRPESSLDRALDFISGESAYYPGFDDLLSQQIRSWWAERAGGVGQ